MPGVLWAYPTTVKMSIGETPYSLVYGADALIPLEIGEPSLRYAHATEESNSINLSEELDFLEERRELALIRIVAQKE